MTIDRTLLERLHKQFKCFDTSTDPSDRLLLAEVEAHLKNPGEPATPDDFLVIGTMYVDAELSRGTLIAAAEDVLKAIVPHPKFQHKTRLIWAPEIENLRGVLDNVRRPMPHAARDGMLNRRGLPTPEQAKRMALWLRGMMQLSEPEQRELREKLERLGAGEGATP